MFKKMFEKKFENITNCWKGGRKGGEVSFQCLRPSSLLMAAGKNYGRRTLKITTIVLVKVSI
jgi:hypothetical protein